MNHSPRSFLSPRHLCLVLAAGIALLTSYRSYAQTAPDAAAHEARPDGEFLTGQSGKWAVTTTIWPERGAQPIVLTGLVAERSMIGPWCVHELMQPGTGSKAPAFQRISDLAYNKNEQRWDYISIDTRITAGVMYFTYLTGNKDSIVSYIPGFPFPGIGPELKDRGQLTHARSVIIQAGADRQIVKIYFRFPGQPEWLFNEYDYTRMK